MRPPICSVSNKKRANWEARCDYLVARDSVFQSLSCLISTAHNLHADVIADLLQCQRDPRRANRLGAPVHRHEQRKCDVGKRNNCEVLQARHGIQVSKVAHRRPRLTCQFFRFLSKQQPSASMLLRNACIFWDGGIWGNEI